MIAMPLHITDGDEAAFLFADKVEGDRVPREFSERMTGGESLATKSIDTKVVSVDYHYVYTLGI